MKYHCYTDGSSRGNPGPGGWGLVILTEQEDKVIFTENDRENPTTNNRMELKAMIAALQYAAEHDADTFIIYSDSTYVVNSCNTWIWGWVKNNWRNSKKQEVENLDLMKEIYALLSRDFFNAEVRLCKGHNGIAGNELADALATGSGYYDLLEHYCIEPEEPVKLNWTINEDYNSRG